MKAIHTDIGLDWYDGLVIGVGRLEGRPGARLISLLAFEPGARRRAYALVSVSRDDVSRIAQLSKLEWSELLAGLRAICQSKAGDALVIVVDGDDNLLFEQSVSLAALSADLLTDIEAAVAPARARWLDLGPAT